MTSEWIKFQYPNACHQLPCYIAFWASHTITLTDLCIKHSRKFIHSQDINNHKCKRRKKTTYSHKLFLNQFILIKWKTHAQQMSSNFNIYNFSIIERHHTASILSPLILLTDIKLCNEEAYGIKGRRWVKSLNKFFFPWSQPLPISTYTMDELLISAIPKFNRYWSRHVKVSALTHTYHHKLQNDQQYHALLLLGADICRTGEDINSSIYKYLQTCHSRKRNKKLRPELSGLYFLWILVKDLPQLAIVTKTSNKKDFCLAYSKET